MGFRHRWWRRAPLLVMCLLSACGGDSGSAGVAIIATTFAPTPSPSPTPTISTSGSGVPVPAGSLAGLAAIASGVDVAGLLQPAHGSGAIAPSEPPVGAFRFSCAPSHNSYDDPIVYPGQPGRAHLHTFFGNTKADGNSTYQSLRTTGDSTCNNLLNRSAYWVPSMMNGRGKVVMPDFLTVYYKRIPSTNGGCQTSGKACVPLPRGLRYIFGYDMTRSPAQQGQRHWSWDCDAGDEKKIHWAQNIAQAAVGCPSGARIGVKLVAPTCWNGTELDSPDHRSHMAYMNYDKGDGIARCPTSHPYIVPEFTLGVWWKTDGTLDRSGNESAITNTWYLSSDRMAGIPNHVPGDTMHADWFGAWEDAVMDIWMANCIEKALSCNSGDLGNGLQMKTLAGYSWAAPERLVDPPGS